MKLFKDYEHKYVLELDGWGISKKQPTLVFFYDDIRFIKDDYASDSYQVYTWIIWAASQLDFPVRTYQLVKYAENWYFESDNFDERIENIPEWPFSGKKIENIPGLTFNYEFN